MCLFWLFLYVFVMFVHVCPLSKRILCSCRLSFDFFCTAGLMESAPRPGSAPAVSERLGSIRLDLSGPKIQKIIQVHENIQGISEYPSWSKIPRDSKRFQDHLLGLTGYGSAKSNEITLCDSEISQIFTVAFQAHQFWLQSWYRRLHPVALSLEGSAQALSSKGLKNSLAMPCFLIFFDARVWIEDHSGWSLIRSFVLHFVYSNELGHRRYSTCNSGRSSEVCFLSVLLVFFLCCREEEFSIVWFCHVLPYSLQFLHPMSSRHEQAIDVDQSAKM